MPAVNETFIVSLYSHRYFDSQVNFIKIKILIIVNFTNLFPQF